jgi:hypothetical protein
MRRPSDRAVSETVSYVIVVALILGSVTVLFVVGTAGIRDAGTSEQLATAESGMQGLAADLHEVGSEGVPRRRSRIPLSSGQVTFGPPVTIELAAENDDAGAPVNRTNTLRVRPVVYETGDGPRVVYSAGAVIRERPSGAVVRRRPVWTISDDRVAITVVTTTVRGNGSAPNGSVAGQGVAVVHSRHEDRRLLINDTGGYDRLWINVTSPRATAWNRSLDERPGVDCDLTRSGRTECTVSGFENLSTARGNVSLTFE